MTEEKIISLFLQRSEEALVQTKRRYGAYCRNIALSILRNEEDAAECENDTYLNAWNAIPPSLPKSLKTFLGRLTRNLALDRFRRYSAEKRSSHFVCSLVAELEDCIPDRTDVSDSVDAKRLASLISSFLHGLPRESRKLFVQRYWFGRSVKELAAANSCTEGKVKTDLHRLRKSLNQAMAKEGFKHEV